MNEFALRSIACFHQKNFFQEETRQGAGLNVYLKPLTFKSHQAMIQFACGSNSMTMLDKANLSGGIGNYIEVLPPTYYQSRLLQA